MRHWSCSRPRRLGQWWSADLSVRMEHYRFVLWSSPQNSDSYCLLKSLGPARNARLPGILRVNSIGAVTQFAKQTYRDLVQALRATSMIGRDHSVGSQ